MSNAKRRYRRRRRAMLAAWAVRREEARLIADGYKLQVQLGCIRVWTKVLPPLIALYGDTSRLSVRTVEER